MYSGETQPKCPLSRNRAPSVLRVIQSPSGKVIFVKKDPETILGTEQKSQRTNNGTLEISTFVPRKFPKNITQRTYFQNVFWQNSRQEHNLKLTPQGLCITRHIGGVVAFGAIPNLNPGFRSFRR